MVLVVVLSLLIVILYEETGIINNLLITVVYAGRYGIPLGAALWLLLSKRHPNIFYRVPLGATLWLLLARKKPKAFLTVTASETAQEKLERVVETVPEKAQILPGLAVAIILTLAWQSLFGILIF